MTKVRLALMAFVAMLCLSGFAQAAPPERGHEDDGRPILRVEILLHDTHSKPEGYRDVAVIANDDYYVLRFQRFPTYGDGTGRVRRLENELVRAACAASDQACIALTRRLVIELRYQ